MKHPTKALILSAGLGTRLRPLTNIVPKPLATVLNTPLFNAAVARCFSFGTRSLAVNVHHLAQVMSTHAHEFCKNFPGLNLHISDETHALLGTGGALVQLSEWWAHDSLLVCNGDVLSDISFRDIGELHAKTNSLVTMSVLPKPPPSGAGRSVWVVGNQVRAICMRTDLDPNLAQLEDLKEYSFACAYIASPTFRNYLPKVACSFDLIEGLNRAITDKQLVSAVAHRGFWADVGSPESLWDTNLDVLSKSQTVQRSIMGMDFSPLAQNHICNSVIASGVLIPNSAIVKNSVLLQGSHVSDGERIENSLRGFGLDMIFRPR